ATAVAAILSVVTRVAIVAPVGIAPVGGVAIIAPGLAGRGGVARLWPRLLGRGSRVTWRGLGILSCWQSTHQRRDEQRQTQQDGPQADDGARDADRVRRDNRGGRLNLDRQLDDGDQTDNVERGGDDTGWERHSRSARAFRRGTARKQTSDDRAQENTSEQGSGARDDCGSGIEDARIASNVDAEQWQHGGEPANDAPRDPSHTTFLCPAGIVDIVDIVDIL